jgi:heptose I phosphotransferase
MKTYSQGQTFLRVGQEFVPLLQLAGLTSYQAVAGLAALDVHRAVPGRRTYRVEIVGERVARAYVKRAWPVTLWENVLRLSPWWRDGAENEWQRLRELEWASLAAPRAVAYGQKRSGGRVVESLLLMTEVAGAEQGDHFFERLAQQGGTCKEDCKRQWIAQLGDFARKFHAAGFYHRDFYLCHFWFATANGENRLWLLDHHRTGRNAVRWWRRRWRIKDVAQLHYSASPLIFSRTDRLRFLRRYFACAKLNQEQRRFVAAVRRKSRRIARHEPKYDTPSVVHGEQGLS